MYSINFTWKLEDKFVEDNDHEGIEKHSYPSGTTLHNEIILKELKILGHRIT